MDIQGGIITFIPGCLLNLLPQPFFKWKVVKQHMFRWGWQRSQRSCAGGWAGVRHSATNMLESGRKPWRNGKSFRKITLEKHPRRMVLSSFMCVFSDNDLLECRWGLAPESRSSLREWLCVEKLEMCCPQDHYGPKCQPCGVLGLGDKVR